MSGSSYGRGARILSIGIAATGLFTFAYFALASHLVGEVPAAPVAQSLNASARLTGFTPRMSIVEITGVCAHCQN